MMKESFNETEHASGASYFWKRIVPALLPVFLLIALPLLMRPASERSASGGTAEKLVIVSAHTEPIKYEFERAFKKYYRENYGKEIEFDWRNVGGTNDIVRYVGDRYEAAFRNYYESRGKDWNEKAAKNFKDSWLSPADDEARALFLDSNVGIGIDLFFGGGTYDQNKFAQIGFGVDAGVMARHPEYFHPDVIPEFFAGEQIYDKKGRFYGLCLSSFGIVYNLDRFEEAALMPPESWTSLCDARLFQKIAVADPTKSGSITKCYEMIIQQAMAEFPDPSDGWLEGMARIKLIAANSRYVTDSAGKLVRDVSSGAAAAGMCIDFYGFSEAEWTNSLAGRERIRYLMPKNGSAVTADPIQLLRGAPNPDVAKAFIDFLLSPAGQKIWLQKPGTPGGPEKYALLRPCVRKDLYSSVDAAYKNNPDYDPYRLSGTFQYHGEWTGRYFTLIRILIKCIALDPMEDLRDAWQAILANGGAENNPEAMAELRRLPFSYDEARGVVKTMNAANPAEMAALRRSWTEFAVQQYRKAAALAKAKGAK